MHKFSNVKGKWVASKTYDLNEYQLTGNWINGFKMTAKDGSFRVFDTDGRISNETDSVGNATRYEYFDTGRLARKITPHEGTTEFRYDQDTGYLKSVIAPGDKVTKFTHDEVGRIISVIGPSPDAANLLPSTVTRFTYNNDNLITSVKMPNGEITQYEYDHAKRLSKIIHPNG
jgi:YD repeat-containing protein